MSEKKIKIKLLKNAGTFTEGQEVEVEETQALAMCTVRKRQVGNTLEDYRVAMTMEEFERRKAAPIELGGLTLDEARALGVKNIVQTPKSELERPFHPGFEEKKDAGGLAAAKQSEVHNQNLKKKAS